MLRTTDLHARVAITTAWLAAVLYSLPAAAQVFNDGVEIFSARSTGLAIAASLVGGTLGSVISLMSSQVAIRSALVESWRGIVYAVIWGFVLHAGIAGWNSVLPPVPPALAILMLGVAGWSRQAGLLWLNRSAARVADGTVDAVIDRIGNAVGGSRGFSSRIAHEREFDAVALDADPETQGALERSHPHPRPTSRFTRKDD